MFDNLGEVIDELCLGATEETFGDLDEQSIMTPEILSEKVNSLKSEVISALQTGTYITPLHRKLATKAQTLKSLDILFEYSSRPEISSEFKQQIGHSVALCYDEYHEAEFGVNMPRDKWEETTPSLSFYQW